MFDYETISKPVKPHLLINMTIIEFGIIFDIFTNNL